MPTAKRKPKPTVNYTLTLTVGDWSMDGHNKTDIYAIRSNKSKNALLDAHFRGLSKLKIPSFQNIVAMNYEDMELPAGIALMLKEGGYPVDKRVERHWTRKDEYMLSVETYVDIWMFIAKKGAPSLKYKVVKYENNINIGGYGLFST